MPGRIRRPDRAAAGMADPVLRLMVDSDRLRWPWDSSPSSGRRLDDFEVESAQLKPLQDNNRFFLRQLDHPG